MTLARWLCAGSLFCALLVGVARGPLRAFPRAPHKGAKEAAHGSPADKLTAEDVAQGKQIFAAQCAGCHGFDGSGQLGPNLHGVEARRGDAGIFWVIRNGTGAMPPVMSLNDQRVWQVVGFVRTLGDTAPVEAAKGDPVKGKAVYEANGCATCHAIAGRAADGPQLTNIGKSRPPKYFHDFLLDPGEKSASGYFAAGARPDSRLFRDAVVTKGGREVSGIRINEDTYTIGSRRGRPLLFVRQIRAEDDRNEPGKSFMPSFTNLSATIWTISSHTWRA